MKETNGPESSLNIVLLPSDAVRQQIIAWSELISAGFATEFTLNQNNLHPHISVFSGVYPEGNVPKLMRAVEMQSSDEKPLNIQMGPFVVMYDTFVFWNCEKANSPGLQNLHEVVTSGVNNLREGLMPSSTKTLTSLTEEDKRLIKEYGGVNNGVNYFPHITISRLKNPQDAAMVLELLNSQQVTDSRFTADSLVVSQMGEHGTISEITMVFPFGNKREKR